MRIYLNALTNLADFNAIIRQIEYHQQINAPEFVIVVGKDGKEYPFESNYRAKEFITLHR